MTVGQPSVQNSSEGQPAVPIAAPLARMDPEMRRSKLALAVQREVVAGGRVESQTDFSAIVRYGKSVNNVLHLLLTLVTFGLWIFVWLAIGVTSVSQNKTVMLTIDEDGQGMRQEV
jgi:hypothetical protein